MANRNIRQYATNGFDKDPQRAKDAQEKSVASRKAHRKENDFSEEVARKMLNYQKKLTAEEQKQMREEYEIEDPAQWQLMMKAAAEEAKQGNYKAFEFLMKLAKLYVEKTESRNENINKNEFATLDEWKAYIRSLNE